MVHIHDVAHAQDKEPIDPLRRVFIPIEKRREDGTRVLWTSDKTKYVRGTDGTIRRAAPKVRGKAARRAERLARRTSR